MTDSIKHELLKVKKQLNFNASDEQLMAACLSVSRVADKKITRAINSYKQAYNIKLSAIQKKKLRDNILGIGPKAPVFFDNLVSFEDKKQALKTIQGGLLRDERKVSGTLKARIYSKNSNQEEYEEIIQREEEGKNQFLLLNVNSEKEHTLKMLKSEILSNYGKLSNYHYMAIVFKNVSWDMIAQIAVYCEYLKIEADFSLFNRNKEKHIEGLCNFLKQNKNLVFSQEVENSVREFFEGVSYGFQFNDLFVSATENVKILVFQKIELDERIFPCPDCMSTIVRGNSYPKLLQKSFECQNPDCPSRSKIGRGKRYDYLSVKRNFLLSRKSKGNLLDPILLKKYRKDIFWDNKSIYNMLISFYSFENDCVEIVSDERVDVNIDTRRISYAPFSQKLLEVGYDKFSQFFSTLVRGIKLQHETPVCSVCEKNFSIYKGNSSTILSNIKEKIAGVITSPPYYNAREYSQWKNLLEYFVDMAINAKSVYEKMQDGTYYFYNIGDIVGQDNIFVSSHMSTKRMMLGFFSIIIFKMVGFYFLDDLIWYKGEVQSKRNSSDNVFPTYIKPVNCYEHILIFSKKAQKISLKENFFDISPVRKINSKGENTLGHTAPFPEEIVKLIFPYLEGEGYLLDPFLGSGTTVIAALKHGLKAIGIEINDTYYNLSLKRIESVLKEKQNIQMQFEF